MELADLARWTPIAVDVSGPQPSIDWCDLSDVRFDDPFFDQTVARCRDGRAVVRTDLDALLALDAFPSIEPAGFIFHLSRCGSTLVTRLLQTMRSTLVVVEPAVLNAVLRLAPDRVDEAVRVEVLRLLIRALGRGRPGDEVRSIIKFSSWNILRAPLLTAAFPEVPKIWLQRSPLEVAASLLARPPGWLSNPSTMQEIFAVEAAGSSDERVARALDTMLGAAGALQPDRCFDYRQLPDAIWQEIAPLFGIEITRAQREIMRAQARFSAKSAVPIPYEVVPTSGEPDIARVYSVDMDQSIARYRALGDAIAAQPRREVPCFS
jgi:hypothetical protein